MTPAELIEARRTLGLKAADLGRALELEGRDPGRMVRSWETKVHPIPGPVAVAVRLMLQDKARQGLQEALERAGAAQAATTAHAIAQALQQDRLERGAEGMPPAPRAMTDLMRIPKVTRRRGA